MTTVNEREAAKNILTDEITRTSNLFKHWNNHYISCEDGELRSEYARKALNAYRELTSAERMLKRIEEEENED